MSLSGESDTWEVTIEHGGLWPLRWSWEVLRTRWEDGRVHVDRRSGECRTKEKAQRKAAAARVAMEREDFHMIEER